MVKALAFASGDNKNPVLVSLANENQRKILRVWNVLEDVKTDSGSLRVDLREASKQVSSDADDADSQPSLAVSRPVQQAANQLEIAIAWQSEMFICNANRDSATVVQLPNNTRLNFVSKFLPGSRGLITGYRPGGSSMFTLSRWEKNGSSWRLSTDDKVEFAVSAGGFDLPICLELIPNSSENLMASVNMRRENLEDPVYELSLFRSKPDIGRLKIGHVMLWKGSQNLPRLPVLAAAPQGDLIAVAGNVENQIHVFAVDDLLRKVPGKQVLEGVGINFSGAAFARRAGEAALLLRTSKPQKIPTEVTQIQPGDLIFNISKSNFENVEALSEWKVASGDSGNWTAELVPGDPSKVRVQQGNAERYMIPLLDREATALAIAASGGKMILALASDGPGGPHITLYDLASGEPFRKLMEHTVKILSLAFSEDGRLLVSAGEDQFVSVWTLNDIDETLGQLGRFRATAEDRDGQVVLTGPWLPWPMPNAFQVGDRVTHVIHKGEQFKLTSARDLYDVFSNFQPGSQLTVRRLDRQGVASDTPVQVRQMEDDRKPLFNFFAASGDDEKLDWIGWSPIGYYDSSRRQADEYLGWHFNTDRKDKPTDFADAAEYKSNRQKGLLSRLVKLGRYEPLSLDVKPPRMFLTIPGWDSEAGTLSFSPSKIVLSVENYDAEDIESIRLTLDDVAIGDFAQDIDQSWHIDLSQQRWQRGEHLFVAQLYPRWTESGRPFEKLLRFEYRPPAPVVQFQSQMPADGTLISETFDLKAEIRSAVNDDPFSYEVVQSFGAETLVLDQGGDVLSPVAIDSKIKLRPGKNELSIRASNENGKGDSRESTIVKKTVHYLPAPAPVVTSFDILPDDGSEVVSDTSRITSHDQCQISATVKSILPVRTVSLKVGDTVHELTIDSASDGVQKVRSANSVRLSPGLNRIELAGATDKDSFSEAIDIHYRPLLPAIEITRPSDGILVKSSQSKTEFEIEARLSNENHRNFELRVLQMHRPSPDHSWIKIANPLVDLQLLETTTEGQLAIKLPVDLQRGLNRIELVVSNEGQSRSSGVTVTLVNPPKILSVTANRLPDTPAFLNVNAEVESQSEISDVWINQIKVSEDNLDSRFEPAKGIWILQVKRISIPAAAKSLLVQVATEDGRSESVSSNKLMPLASKPEPPLIQIQGTAQGVAVEKSRYPFTFEVTSNSRLRSITVLHNGKPIPVEKQFDAPPRLGKFQFETRVDVELHPRQNELRVVAINQQGGQTERLINVAYLPPPVRIVIEGLTPRKPDSTAPANPQFRPVDWRPDLQTKSELAGHPGTVYFENAFDSSQLWLHARIDWNPDAGQAPAMADLIPVQVWVNGFQQASRVIHRPDKSSSHSQRFDLPITLNQARNEVHLKAVGLPTGIDGEPDFEVECSSPSTEQWLHLLVLGIDLPDSEIDRLEEQALNAFHAKRVENSSRRFTTNAFSRGTLYRTPDYVSYPQFNQALQEIRQIIRENTRRIPNHVLAIYYRGGQIVRYNDKTYLTLKAPGKTPLASLEFNSIDLEALEENFSQIWGAHLLFLDASQAETERFLLAKDSQTALFPQMPGRFEGLLMAVNKALESEFVDLDGLKQNLMSQLLGSQPNQNYAPIVPDAMAGLILKK